MIDQLKQTLKKLRVAMDKKNPLVSMESTNVWSAVHDDLNNYKQPGTHCVFVDALHKPSNVYAALMFVISYDMYYIYQFLFTIIPIGEENRGKMYVRVYTNTEDLSDTWTEWQQIQTTEVQAVSSDEELSDETEVV